MKRLLFKVLLFGIDDFPTRHILKSHVTLPYPLDAPLFVDGGTAEGLSGGSAQGTRRLIIHFLRRKGRTTATRFQSERRCDLIRIIYSPQHSTTVLVVCATIHIVSGMSPDFVEALILYDDSAGNKRERVGLPA